MIKRQLGFLPSVRKAQPATPARCCSCHTAQLSPTTCPGMLCPLPSISPRHRISLLLMCTSIRK